MQIHIFENIIEKKKKKRSKEYFVYFIFSFVSRAFCTILLKQ